MSEKLFVLVGWYPGAVSTGIGSPEVLAITDDEVEAENLEKVLAWASASREVKRCVVERMRMTNSRWIPTVSPTNDDEEDTE